MPREYRLVRQTSANGPPTLSLHQIFCDSPDGPIFYPIPVELRAKDLQALCDIMSGFAQAMKHDVLDHNVLHARLVTYIQKHPTDLNAAVARGPDG